MNHITRLTVFCLMGAVPLAACSSSGGSGEKSTPTPAPGSSSGPGTGNGTGKKDGDAKPKALTMDWVSDTRDAVVAPCVDEQVFARETCWDAVELSEARLALRRPGEELVVFESGKPLSEAIAPLYRYSGEAYLLNSLWNGDDQSLINEGVERLRERIPNHFIRYWLLPSEVIISKTQGRALNDEVAVSADFPLTFSFGYSLTRESGTARDWNAKGTATLCGKVLPLPLRQQALEEACGWTIGTEPDVTSTDATGNAVTLTLGGETSDLANRFVNRIRFRASNRTVP